MFDMPLSSVAFFAPVVVSFGGGLNSTAMLCEWATRKCLPPHKIIFADTGGERPDVYEHVAKFSDWLVGAGFPKIDVAVKGGRKETLEEYSLRREELPSLAYGRKGCSWKFKIEPQDREVNHFPPAKREWKNGGKVVKLIGYGYEEQRRISLAKIEDDKYYYRFPLNEWRMDRDACAASVRRAGLPVPGKSSCFFCPASRKPEILALPPELLARAIRIEDTARASGKLQTSQGLGRRFAWRDFIAGEVVTEDAATVCMYCADGDEDQFFAVEGL